MISDWLSSTIPPFFSTLAAARMRPTANSSGFGPNWRCRVYKKAHRAARKRPILRQRTHFWIGQVLFVYYIIAPLKAIPLGRA